MNTVSVIRHRMHKMKHHAGVTLHGARDVTNNHQRWTAEPSLSPHQRDRPLHRAKRRRKYDACPLVIPMSSRTRRHLDIDMRIFNGIGSHFDFIARHFQSLYQRGFRRTPGQRGIELDFFLFYFLLVSLLLLDGLSHPARDFFRLSHRLRRSNIRQHELHHALQNFRISPKNMKAIKYVPLIPTVNKY